MPVASDKALQFYLQLDDAMSPVLLKAEKNYRRLTKSLNTLNTNLQESGKEIIRTMERVAHSVDTAYKKMGKSVGRSKQRMAGGGKKGYQIVLSPRYPKERDTSVWPGTDLRRAYRQSMIQPPEYIGKITPFAKGGATKKPQVAMIGEQGSELVAPLGTVMNKMGDILQKTLMKVVGAPGFRAEAGGRMRGPKGQFASKADFQKAIEDTMGRRLDKLTSLFSAGVGGLMATKGGGAGAVAPGVMPSDLAGLQKELVKTSSEFEKLMQVERNCQKAGELLSSGIAFHRDLLKDSTITQEEYNENIALLQKEYENNIARLPEVSARLDEVGNRQDRLNDAIKEMANVTPRASKGLMRLYEDAKEAVLGASGIETGIISLGVASFTTAARMQDDFLRVQTSMGMTGKQFESVKKLGLSAMIDLGISSGEMIATLQQAAKYKIKGPELKPFVRIVGMATQGLQHLGATEEDVGKLVFQMKNLGIPMKDSEKVLSGLIYVAESSALSFGELSDALESNMAAFQMIRLRGGDAGKAMVNFSATVGAFGNLLGDAQKTGQMLGDMMDPAKFAKNSGIFTLVARATNQTVQDMQKTIAEGDFGKFGKDLMTSIQGMDPNQLMMLGSQMETLYGIDYDQLLNIKMNADPKALEDMVAGAMKAQEEGKLLKKRFDEFNATLMGLVTRIKNTVVPVLITLGEPLVWLASVVLTPVLWGLKIFSKILVGMGKPLQTLVSLILAAAVALTVWNRVKKAGLWGDFVLEIKELATSFMGAVGAIKKYILEGGIANTLEAVWTKAKAAYTFVQGVLTTGIWASTAAIRANTLAFLANPVVWIAGLILATYAAFKYLGTGVGLVTLGVSLLTIGIYALNTAWLSTGIGALISGAIFLVIGAVWLLIKALTWLWKKMEMGKVFGAVFSAMGTVISVSAGGMGSVFEYLGGKFDWMAGMAEKLIRVWDKVKGLFGRAWSGVKGAAKSVGGSVGLGATPTAKAARALPTTRGQKGAARIRAMTKMAGLQSGETGSAYLEKGVPVAQEPIPMTQAAGPAPVVNVAPAVPGATTDMSDTNETLSQIRDLLKRISTKKGGDVLGAAMEEW